MNEPLIGPSTSGSSGNNRAILYILRAYGVVPFTLEAVADDVEGLHLGVGNRDALRIGRWIEFAANAQPGLGGGADQIDDDAVADQRRGAPVHADEGKQAMLSSCAGKFDPHALLEPYVKLSLHTAPDVRPPTCRNSQ